MMPASAKEPPTPTPVLKHPGRWVWLLLAIPVIIGLTRLSFDVEVFDLLPTELKEVQGLVIYQEHFANARELIITLKGTDPARTEEAARSISARLRERPELISGVTWQPPWLEHPEQSAELIAYLWLNQPPEVLRDLTNRLAPEKLPELLTSAREEIGASFSPQEIARLSYDPFGFTRLPESVSGAAPMFSQGQEAFASADGTFRLVFVQSARDLRTYRQCKEWLAAVKPMVEQALSQHRNSAAELSAGYTGRPVFVAEIASGMERDMTLSVGGTAIIIAFLFWLAHRRFKPMLWLLTLLGLILGSTLALGGLIYGTINVVSVGFAAILLGLAVDYAVVHYQEALAHPGLSIPQIRHAIAPSIFWAATTTIAAFLVLNFGGLPGLGQLGTLVGLGVALAATIMIFEFLPPLFPGRNIPRPVAEPELAQSPGTTRQKSATPVFIITGAVILTTAIVLAMGIPPIDPTANALRPRHSAAYAALDEIQNHLNQKREPLWLIVSGASVPEVSHRLERVQQILERATTNQDVTDFVLPTALWPRVESQTANRVIALHLISEAQMFRQAALSNGFSETALGLSERILETWKTAAATPGIYWPTNTMSRWIFDKISATTPTNYFALGLVNPNPAPGRGSSAIARLQSELPKEQVWLSGWQMLGGAIFARVKANMWKVVVPMVLLVFISLLLAFRRPLEIFLSVGVILLSGFCLLTFMRLAGWSWNLLNLMAVPLILGTGVDYSLFMQLALRRHHGNVRIAYQSVGRALLLCGGTAIAGFGSLGLSSNAGMASLGQVCAVGIASNMLIAIFLLPTWWRRLGGNELRIKGSPASGESPSLSTNGSEPSTPSSLYRSEVWRLGIWMVRVLPHSLCNAVAKFFSLFYWMFAAHRRKVVVENLLPACGHDLGRARKSARHLFTKFALKVVDLWRFEAGLPIDHLFGQTSGWEHFEAAQAQKRGILLLTPHLGNWEFGGPLLTNRGVALQIITLAEPGENFTELRQASRARWNIETLVIRDDPMAFLEIIRRLEGGATVALLIDRPPPPTAVTVELFGRPFETSIAAAELARASGCVLLPVYLPRCEDVYEAHILPAVAYERPQLRDRAARRDLAQRIMHAFEPLIRKHCDQWYHFVPIWPKAKP